ncbi:MAG TPA: hypothetical protein EYP29_00245 [Thermoplasmata archaeon]|nr:hypothetical protein [Thermoplasmata archaeon]
MCEKRGKPVVVLSKGDMASENIAHHFLETVKNNGFSVLKIREIPLPSPSQKITHKMAKMREYHNFYFIVSEVEHLYLDYVGELVKEVVGHPPSFIVFLSRHKSEKGLRSLTVHPTGNFKKPLFGGKERDFSFSEPYYQSFALRTLFKFWKSQNELKDFSISFEATHHGPYLNTPGFFIEIGSTEKEWNRKEAGALLGATVFETLNKWASEKTKKEKRTTAIGVGGGHYAPRFSQYAVGKDYDFGHIVPGYACETLDPELCQKLIERTPGVNTIFLHGNKYREFGKMFLKAGKEIGIELDLEVLK